MELIQKYLDKESQGKWKLFFTLSYSLSEEQQPLQAILALKTHRIPLTFKRASSVKLWPLSGHCGAFHSRNLGDHSPTQPHSANYI